MKKINSNVSLILLLIVISIAIYILQMIQFHSPRDTAFYFLQDMAFLPLQVSIVTIVLGRILNAREKRERLKKINMAISAFFCFVLDSGKGKLDALFIDPKFIGKGYGRLLWSNILTIAKEKGVNEFTIDTDPPC